VIQPAALRCLWRHLRAIALVLALAILSACADNSAPPPVTHADCALAYANWRSYEAAILRMKLAAQGIDCSDVNSAFF
jgi:hypothetical protein